MGRNEGESSRGHSKGGGQLSIRQDGKINTTSVMSGSVRKVKRKVLDEDEYITKLSGILRRDFFPTLDRLEAQYDYLNAMEREDLTALRSASNRLRRLDATASTGSAPNMSLDEFQARYVTEDTAEFEDLLDRINDARRGRFAKVFRRETPLLLPAATEAPPSRGSLRKENTRIEKDIDLGILEGNPDDIRYQYWRMLKEHGEEDDSARSVSESTGTGQIRGYSFVETPQVHNEGITPDVRRYQVPETPSRDLLGHSLTTTKVSKKHKEQSDLFKTPAVQRLLRAHTPKIGSVFDNVPKTPKRKQ